MLLFESDLQDLQITDLMFRDSSHLRVGPTPRTPPPTEIDVNGAAAALCAIGVYSRVTPSLPDLFGDWREVG